MSKLSTQPSIQNNQTVMNSFRLLLQPLYPRIWLCRLFLKIRANLWQFSRRADALFTPVNLHSLAGQTAHLPLNNTPSRSFWHTVLLPLFCLALFVSCVAEDPDSAESVPAPETTLRSEEHTSELQSRGHLVCRLLLAKKNNNNH